MVTYRVTVVFGILIHPQLPTILQGRRCGNPRSHLVSHVPRGLMSAVLSRAAGQGNNVDRGRYWVRHCIIVTGFFPQITVCFVEGRSPDMFPQGHAIVSPRRSPEDAHVRSSSTPRQESPRRPRDPMTDVDDLRLVGRCFSMEGRRGKLPSDPLRRRPIFFCMECYFHQELVNDSWTNI